MPKVRDEEAGGDLMSYPEITFKEFSQLMQKRGRTLDDLVEIFRGKIEDPREFLERALSCKYHHEDRAGVVIPYRSVIEFYQKELHYYEDQKKRPRVGKNARAD